MCDNHISQEKAKEKVKKRVIVTRGTEETVPLVEATPEDVPVAAPLSSTQDIQKAQTTNCSRSRRARRLQGRAHKPVLSAAAKRHSPLQR